MKALSGCHAYSSGPAGRKPVGLLRYQEQKDERP